MARLTKAQLKGKVATLLPDNMTGEVSVADVRGLFVDLIDSLDAEPDQGDELTRPGFAEIQAGTSATPRAWAAADVKTGVDEYEPPDYSAPPDSRTTTDNRTFNPAQIADIADEVVDDSVEDWARDGNTPIPRSKLSEAPSAQGQTQQQVADAIQTHTDDEDAHHTPGLDQDAVDARINSNPLVTGHEEFETALRSDTSLLSNYAITIAVSNAAARVANVLIPSAEAEREMVLSVRNSLNHTTSHRFDLTTIRNLPTVSASQQLNSTNAIEVPNDEDSENYYLGHGGGNNQLYFSSDTNGTFYVSILDSRINVTPYVRDLPLSRTDGDLPASRVSGLPAAGGDVDTAALNAAIAAHKAESDAHHTPPDAGLATVATDDTIDGDGTAGTPLKVADPYTAAKVNDAISSRLATIDAVFTASFTAAAGSGQDAGSTGIFTTLPTNFTIAARTYHVEQVFQTSADNDLWIGFSSRLPDGYAVQINEHKVALRYVQEVGGDFRYLADGAPAGTVVVGNNTITIYEPVSEENFLPGGGRPGQIVEAQAGGERVWTDLPVPRSATTSLWDRHSQGIAIANAGVASRSSFFVSDTPYVIGDKHGLVFVTAEWRIVAGVNMQLGDDVLDSFDITLSDLRASTAYDNAAVNGIKVGSVELQSTASGNPKIGDVDLYVGKNGSDQIGFWLNHTVSGGTAQQTATSIQAVLSIRVFQHDGTASAGGGGSTTDELRIAATANQLVATGVTLPETGIVVVAFHRRENGAWQQQQMASVVLEAAVIRNHVQFGTAGVSVAESRGASPFGYHQFWLGRQAITGYFSKTRDHELLVAAASNAPTGIRFYVTIP